MRLRELPLRPFFVFCPFLVSVTDYPVHIPFLQVATADLISHPSHLYINNDTLNKHTHIYNYRRCTIFALFCFFQVIEEATYHYGEFDVYSLQSVFYISSPSPFHPFFPSVDSLSILSRSTLHMYVLFCVLSFGLSPFLLFFCW